MVLFRKKTIQDRRQLLASTDSVSKTRPEAFQHLRENLDMYDLEAKTGANDLDLLYLKTLLENPTVHSLVQTQDKLEISDKIPEPVSTGNVKLIRDITQSCQLLNDSNAKELVYILNKPHFKALLDSHDSVASTSSTGNGDIWKPIENQNQTDGDSEAMETIKVISMRKIPGQPLGLTVEEDKDGNLIVARILAGSSIDRLGLLKPGDAILEVNGVSVSTPIQLQHEVIAAKENLTFRVASCSDNNEKHIVNNCYMRALFDYEPTEDSLLPCKEIGLAFKKGDILQIVNQRDPNWWQAKLIGSDGPAGLIPSQELEERRKAFVPPEADFVHKISICGTRISKKKRKIIYQSKANVEFDKAELLLYEEVMKIPPFSRRTLALIGCSGVGRRTLKNRLINSDPEKFAAVAAMTSRPQRELEENGKSYWFVSREELEANIRDHKMLEYGEHNGHLYGTSLESIQNVIKEGKMCVLDCSPAALKILHNSTEFRPYVIFIAAPGEELLKQMYDFSRSTGTASRNLTFDRQSSIRYSSRRAKTLESLASLYEDDDVRRTVEESALLLRTYSIYIDQVIVNEDFDVTFRKVVEALDTLRTKEQWVPLNWVY